MKLLLVFALLLQGNEAALRARIAELEAQVKVLETNLATTKPAPSGWNTVGSWKGTGTKTTESFATKGAEWRINWKSASDGILQIMVYDANNKLVALAANSTAAGSDVSYVRGAPGRYYLTINSANTNWEVTAEEKQDFR
jgi:hypothetical protein